MGEVWHKYGRSKGEVVKNYERSMEEAWGVSFLQNSFLNLSVAVWRGPTSLGDSRRQVISVGTIKITARGHGSK